MIVATLLYAEDLVTYSTHWSYQEIWPFNTGLRTNISTNHVWLKFQIKHFSVMWLILHHILWVEVVVIKLCQLNTWLWNNTFLILQNCQTDHSELAFEFSVYIKNTTILMCFSTADGIDCYSVTQMPHNEFLIASLFVCQYKPCCSKRN